jgi:hypothetical protein
VPKNSRLPADSLCRSNAPTTKTKLILEFLLAVMKTRHTIFHNSRDIVVPKKMGCLPVDSRCHGSVPIDEISNYFGSSVGILAMVLYTLPTQLL